MSDNVAAELRSGEGVDPELVEPALVNHRTVVGHHRRASTRARIVEAAVLVYAEKGADAPVIDDFVKAAGLSRGTFYNHFTTTTDLLEATIEHVADNLARAIYDAIAPYDDVVEKAAMAMRSHLHWITSNPGVCAFFAKVPRVGEAARRYARLQLRLGIANGAFDVADIDAACDLEFGVLSEAIRRIAGSPSAPKRCDEVVGLVLVGLGVDKGRIRQVMAMPLPTLDLPLRER